MNEQNQKSKKKVLLYYLILAACLLVIAAVTVTVVLTVKRAPQDGLTNTEQGSDNSAEGNKPSKPSDGNNNNGNNNGNNGNNNGDGNTPDDGNNNKPNDKPTASDDGFCLPVNTASITCGYEFAFDKTLDRYCVHQGMDFAAEAGTSVFAVEDGVVTKIVNDHILSENYITVTHKNGVTTTYKYVVAEEGLTEGTNVKKGDKIGEIAQAAGMEMSQGDHLHFEVAVNGKTADPDIYLEITEK